MKGPPKPVVSMKSKVEFDVKSEPEYDVIMENVNEPGVMESELETEVQIKIEPIADVWIKSEPEAEISDIDEVELKNDEKIELEFGDGTEVDSFEVRIFIASSYVANLN